MPIYVPPAGITPMGAYDGDPRGPYPPPPVIRADKIDPVTQEFTSLFSDQDPVDAAVIEALWRVKGSGAAVQDVGARFLDIPKIDDQHRAQVEGETRNALRRLVLRGDIFLKSVKVTVGPDWSEVEVTYLNLRAKRDRDQERRAVRRLPEWVNDGQT